MNASFERHRHLVEGWWVDKKYLVFFFFFLIFLFFYFWLCWVFVSVRGLSLVAASGGHSSSQCAGLSLSRPLLLRSTGSRCAGSVVVAHGPSCSAACGIFPEQGSNPCPLHWQADSQPLHHQGSPTWCFLITMSYYKKNHLFYNMHVHIFTICADRIVLLAVWFQVIIDFL